MFETFASFPVLESEHLFLNELTMQDLNDFHAMRSDVHIMQYIQGRLAKTIDDSKAVIEKCEKWKEDGNNISWAMRDKENHRLIGTIGYYRIQWNNYRGEAGYMLHPDYQGKGMMSEALRKIADFGFQKLKFHTIEAVIDPENKKSANILVRNGFVKEAYHKENMFSEGKFYDSEVYTLFRDEFYRR